MCAYSSYKNSKRTEESAADRTELNRFISFIWRSGFSLILVSYLFTGLAAAQQEGVDCPEDPSSAITQLIVLINNLQRQAVIVAVPLAGLIYSYCGLLWLSGSPELQRKARRIFANATIGLVIVILSEGIVDIIAGPLPVCGGAV